LAVALVNQVLLVDPLGQRRGQLGYQVGGIDVVGERNGG
jgi:hypothetical protein